MRKKLVYALLVFSLLVVPAIAVYAGTPKAILDELDTCKVERSDLQKANAGLKADKESLTKKVSALEADKKKLQEKIASLERQIAKREEEVGAIEEEARDMMIVSKTVEERIQEQEAEIAELRMDKEEKEAEITRLRMEKESLEEEKFKLESDVRQINIQITRLEAKNEDLEKENEEMGSALAEYERIQRKSQDLMELALKRINQVLREEIETGKVRVFKGTMGIVLDVTSEYMFDMGKVEINPGGKVILRKIAGLLDELDGYLVGIIGNADSKPIITPSLKKRFPTNWELSAHRSAVIVRYLLGNSSVSPRRMVVLGLGEHQPIDSNLTEDGRGNNRRVDIVLLPIDVLSAVVVGAEIK
ncbi:MAG: OmpA family protein [Spirochaetes bacterium]|nr:OmpA family protein [Spirochaetota bacterium]